MFLTKRLLAVTVLCSSVAIQPSSYKEWLMPAAGVAAAGAALYGVYQYWPQIKESLAAYNEAAPLAVYKSNISQYEGAFRENEDLLVMLARYQAAIAGQEGYQPYPVELIEKYKLKNNNLVSPTVKLLSTGIHSLSATAYAYSSSSSSSAEEKKRRAEGAEKDAIEAESKRRMNDYMKKAKEDNVGNLRVDVAKALTINSWFRESIKRYMNGQREQARLTIWSNMAIWEIILW